MMSKMLKILGVVVLVVFLTVIGIGFFTNETHYYNPGMSSGCPLAFSKPFLAEVYHVDKPFSLGEGMAMEASCSFSPYYFIGVDVLVILLIIWGVVGYWTLLVSLSKKFIEKRVLWQRSLFWLLAMWWFVSMAVVVGWMLYLLLTRL